MGWSWRDYLALPADYVDVVVEWINERERELARAREARG